MSRNLPSLNAIRAFEAAARHQSLTRAASELFVTHAAISRHVRLLEEWLEVELFVRHPQGVTLTDAGERYLKRLTPIFDDLVAATRELRADDIVSTLTISVEVPFATRWLIPRLGQLRAVCPNVELNINPSDKLINFRDDEAQFGIRFGMGDWPDVTAVRLTNVEIFPVCSPDLVEGRELDGDLSALQDFTLIHEAKKRYWQRWLELAGVDEVDTQKGPILSNIHFALQGRGSRRRFRAWRQRTHPRRPCPRHAGAALRQNSRDPTRLLPGSSETRANGGRRAALHRLADGRAAGTRKFVARWQGH